MNLQNQPSIRRQLLITFTLLAVIPLLFLGMVISIQSVLFQKGRIQAWMHEITAQAALTISYYLSEQEHKLQLLHRSNYLPAMTPEELSSTISKFMSASKDDKHGYVFNHIIVLNHEGRELIRVSRKEMIQAESMRDWSDQPEYQRALEIKQHVHSDVYYDEKTGEPLTRIIFPLIDLQTSEVKGMLVAEMQLIFMRSVMSNVKIGKSGLAFIVDDNGRIISHPNASEILKGEVFAPPDRPQIQKFVNNGYAVTAAHLIDFGQDPFYLVTKLPVSEAFSHIPGFLIIIAFTMLMAGLVAVALGFLLVKQIVGPVEALASTVRRIANGNFSLRADIDSKNEIGGLAEDFNIMTGKLVESMNAYEQEKNLVKKAIDSLCHPFFIVDVQTHEIKLANSAARFGELSTASKCHVLTHHSDTPCDSQEHPCPIREILKTKKPVMVEHVHYDENGIPGIYEVHGYPIFNESGEVFQVIEYVIDITERKRIEQNLWRAREAGMAEVAAEVMHNIGNAITPAKIAGLNIWRRLEKNPLRTELEATFTEFSDLVVASPSTSVEEKQRISKIATLLPRTIFDEFDYLLEEMIKVCKKHEHIEHIINLQNKYAQKRGLVAEVNLNDMVDDALQILNDLLASNAVKVDKHYGDLPRIKTERSKLLEVLISLIKNGLEATLVNTVENRRLTLSTDVMTKEGDFVSFAVKDNGAGFTENEKGKLFSFSYVSTDESSGMELHAIANYVNLVKGTIEAFSDGPGTGSTFVAHLPVK